MKSRYFLLLSLTILLLGLFIQISKAEIELGVKAGDWAKYKVTLYSSFPEKNADLMVEIISVQDLNLLINITYSYEDGRIDTEYIEGELGKSDLQGFIAPANLVIGDSFPAASSLSISQEYTYYDAVIKEYDEKVISDKKINAVYGEITTAFGANINSWWEKETGLLLETQNNRGTELISIAKLVDTNLLNSSFSKTTPDESPTLPIEEIIGISLIVIIVITIVGFKILKK